mmetsp:Transcript_23761/g.60043  ORF Transcript_23761/g.60043 Transcript_23761/m.60043 type:complete len:224 (+) Transcript_23761:1175-1846(+)
MSRYRSAPAVWMRPCRRRISLRNFACSSCRRLKCASPLRRVDCCTRNFSYSRFSSSLRLISCVARMLRCPHTAASSFFCASRSSSAPVIVDSIFFISRCCSSVMFWSCPCLFFVFSRWSFTRSISLDTFTWSQCFLMSSPSRFLISSRRFSIWWYMPRNLSFMLPISSCASARFFEYRFRSVRTASYKFFCWWSFALISTSDLFKSATVASRSATVSWPWLYF